MCVYKLTCSKLNAHVHAVDDVTDVVERQPYR